MDNNPFLISPQQGASFFSAQAPEREDPSVGVQNLVRKAAIENGVDPAILLAIAKHESSFNPGQVGPQTKYGKPLGLFQYLPSTADGLGINPLDPEESANAAAQQFKMRQLRGGTDWAIASHFAGDDPKQHGPLTSEYVNAVKRTATSDFGWGQDAVTDTAPTTPQPAAAPVGTEKVNPFAIGPDVMKRPEWAAALEAMPKEQPAVSKDTVPDMVRGVPNSLGARGTGAVDNPLVPVTSSYVDVFAKKPAKAWVKMPDGSIEQQEPGALGHVARGLMEVGTSLQHLVTGIRDTSAVAAAQANVDAANAHPIIVNPITGETDGWTHTDPAALRQANIDKVVAVTQLEQHNKELDQSLARFPNPTYRQKFAKEQQEAPTTAGATLGTALGNPLATATGALEMLGEFLPVIAASRISPTAGSVAATTQVAGQAYASAVHEHLQSIGAPVDDPDKLKAFLVAHPSEVDRALNSANLKAGVAAGSVAILGPVGEATGGILPKTGSVLTRTARQTAASFAATGTVFAGATAATNAAEGKPTTGKDILESYTSALPFIAKDIHETYENIKTGDAMRLADVHRAAILNHIKAVQEARASAQKASDLANIDNTNQQDKENALSTAFPQTSTEQKSAEEEAGFRTLTGEQTANKLSQNPAFRVTPASPTSPEQVQAEWQSQKTAVDSDLDRVDLGQHTDLLRQRQAALAKQQTDAEAAQRKAEQDAIKATAAKEATRKTQVADQLLKENPGLEPEQLAPLLRERLASLPPIEPVKPKVVKAATTPAPEAPTAATEASEKSTVPFPTENGVPTMITYRIRQYLKDRGASDEDINKLTPKQAIDLANSLATPAVPKAERTAPTADTRPAQEQIEERLGLKPGYTEDERKAATHSYFKSGLVSPEAKESLRALRAQAEQEAQEEPPTEAEQRELARQAGMHVPEPPAGLNMAATNSSETELPFHKVLAKTISALFNHNTAPSLAAQTLIRQGKFVFGKNPQQMGMPDTGGAAHFAPDGRVFIYTDRMDPKDVVGHIIAAAVPHEGVHVGQANARAGRPEILRQIMGDQFVNEAKEKLAKLYGKNTLATRAIDSAAKAGRHAGGNETVANLEVMAYFAQHAATDRANRKGLGRLGGLANDMVAKTREFLREKLGANLDVNINDLAFATRRIASEVAKTSVDRGAEHLLGDKAPLNMIGGTTGEGFDEAFDLGRAYVGKEGAPRYEFSDHAAELNLDPHVMSRLGSGKAVKLSEILPHEELDKHYPGESSKITVAVSSALPLDNAHYLPGRERIEVSPTLMAPERKEELRNVILHEVQHHIQALEGHVSGANARSFMPAHTSRAWEDAQLKYKYAVKDFDLGTAKAEMSPEERTRWEATIKKLSLPRDQEALMFLSSGRGANTKSLLLRRQMAKYDRAKEELDSTRASYNEAVRTADRTYRRDYGEAEARNTEYRSRMTPEERAALRPESTMEAASPDIKSHELLDTSKLRLSGKQLAPESKITTPEFKEWFGESKAIDSEGNPKDFYHGTSKDKDFRAFNINKNGSWFTSSPHEASDYARDNDSKNLVMDTSPGAKPYSFKNVNTADRVLPVNLKMEKPYELTKADHDEINKDNYKRAQGLLFDRLRREGYDSVVLSKNEDGSFHTVAVIGNGAQIKSKFNKGTYSSSKPNILDMAAKQADEPFRDMTSMPRQPGEKLGDWEERIASYNAHPLQTALDFIFKPHVRASILADRQDRKEDRALQRQMQVAWLSARDRAYAIAENMVKQYKHYFDTLPEKDRMAINNSWETGQEVTDPQAKAFFNLINPIFAQSIETIRQLDPGSLKNLKERYLPHIWEKPEAVARFYKTKGPLSGPKSFLKPQKYPTMQEGMDSGLKPISTNPADLAMAKLTELLKYSGLLQMRQIAKDTGWAVKQDDRDFKAGYIPDGYAVVNDASFRGFVVSAPLANDLNNYLNPGANSVKVFGISPFKAIRYLENIMVPLNLGWSAFHASFTTADNMFTHIEGSGRRILSGDLAGGLTDMIKAPLSIIISPYEGGVLNKIHKGIEPDSEAKANRWSILAGIDAHINALLDLLEKGGARANMDPSEWNGGIAKEITNIKRLMYAGQDTKANAANVVKYAVPAIADASGWLIHRKLVPAQKAAARVFLLKVELDRFAKDLNKERGDYTGIIDALHPNAAAQIARKVVNLVDDRLGQMSYDNQFWNVYVKQVAQLSMLSPGWFVGKMRTITGGVSDLARLVNPEKIIGPLDKEGNITDAHFGRLTGRAANLLIQTMVVGAMGAAMMYYMTGKWPAELKDYIYPKTGRKNVDGTDERISLPTYTKDHFNLFTHPTHELAKLVNNPLPHTLWELATNSDFSNTEIFDPHAPLSTEAAQIAKFLAIGFSRPIVASNETKQESMSELNPTNPSKNTALKVAAFLGATPAPSIIDHTKAQDFINQKYFDSFPKASRSQDAADTSQKKAVAINELRNGRQVDLSQFSVKERREIRMDARMDPYTKRFEGIHDIQDRIQAWDLATPQERAQYKMKQIILRHARTQIARIEDKDMQAEVQQKINQIRGNR